MKRIIKITLVVVVCLISTSAVSKTMSLFHKSTGDFRFEDYKTAEEAQQLLIKMHPSGTPVEALLQRLKVAGADCGPVTNTTHTYNFYCIYKEKIFFIFTYEWHVSIKTDKENNIEWIKLQKGIQAL